MLLARLDKHVVYRHTSALPEADVVTALEKALRQVLDRAEDART